MVMFYLCFYSDWILVMIIKCVYDNIEKIWKIINFNMLIIIIDLLYKSYYF